jgi:hypothetical protein
MAPASSSIDPEWCSERLRERAKRLVAVEVDKEILVMDRGADAAAEEGTHIQLQRLGA